MTLRTTISLLLLCLLRPCASTHTLLADEKTVHDTPQTPRFQLKELPPLPDPEGFAGCFAGISGNHLLVIGGANFPEKKPWENGVKVWSDRVYALPLAVARSIRLGQTPTHPALQMNRTPWKMAGHCQTPTGYGVSAGYLDEVICAGGSHANAHSRSVVAVRYQNSSLTFRQLPELPVPLANHFGTLVGHNLIVSGGQTTSTSAPAEVATWSLNLTQPELGWTALPEFPGAPRILATAATTGKDFWVIGGASLRTGPDGKLQRTWLNDAWRYSTEHGWQQLPALPAPAVAAPSPAPVIQQSPILLGGDDGTQAGSDPRTHRGFPNTSLALTTSRNAWTNSSSFPPAVVTTPTVTIDDFWVIPSGEIRPGIRSPKVWLMAPEKH